MRFLIDMNLSPRWRDALRARGLDAEHWSSLGSAKASDPEILGHAANNGWVLITHDLDFSAILAAAGEASPSVIQIRLADLDPATQAIGVSAAIHQTRTELAIGAVVTVEESRIRVRLLPIAKP